MSKIFSTQIACLSELAQSLGFVSTGYGAKNRFFWGYIIIVAVKGFSDGDRQSHMSEDSEEEEIMIYFGSVFRLMTLSVLHWGVAAFISN